jgi:hypothetical protein
MPHYRVTRMTSIDVQVREDEEEDHRIVALEVAHETPCHLWDQVHEEVEPLR